MPPSKTCQGYIIKPVCWQQAGASLMYVRRTVFMQEQQVPESLEWDGLDEAAHHLLACTFGQEVIGCARILPDGHIGRMAVMPGWRGHGVGRALLDKAILHCSHLGLHEAKLSAQTHAIAFYQKAGFAVCSAVYMDAGIPHCDMILTL